MWANVRDKILGLVLTTCSKLSETVGVDALDPLTYGPGGTPGKGAGHLSDRVSTHCGGKIR